MAGCPARARFGGLIQLFYRSGGNRCLTTLHHSLTLTPLMKVVTSTPLYQLNTADGPVLISHPCSGDSLAVMEENGRYTLPKPIIGWARDYEGQLSVYTVGPDSSLFRLALEDGCEQECFFGGKTPDTLREYRLDEYAPGALLYFPVPLANPALMNISSRMQVAA